MGIEVTILPATMGDAVELAPRMRQSDRDEVLASAGFTPFEALVKSLELSDRAYSLRFGAELGAMYGVAAHRNVRGVGVPWLLTSTEVDRYPVAFLRQSKPALEEMLGMYDALINYVDARYTAALRWAKWLGFHVADPMPFGVAGLPFHPISLIRQGVFNRV